MSRAESPHSARLRSPLAPALLLLAVLLSGCGTTVYQPGAGLQFDLNPAAEIDDEEIRQAFSRRPQMGQRIRVAYFSFDGERVEALDRMLRAQPGVEDVYRIPTVMVTGQRRFDRTRPVNAGGPVSVKKLRLLAARARCDVLLVLDYGHRIETRANGLAALNLLVLPMLFVPYLDKEVQSYLEASIIDTRNGYLYGQASSQQKSEARKLTIYSEQDRALVESQWKTLLADTGQALGQLITAQRTPPPPTAMATR